METILFILLPTFVVAVIIVVFAIVVENKFQEEFKYCELCVSKQNLIQVGYSHVSAIPRYRCAKCLNKSNKNKQKSRRKRSN